MKVLYLINYYSSRGSQPIYEEPGVEGPLPINHSPQ